MPTFRDTAIVLRTHNLGEADRIVTLLSQNHGKFGAVAKGVRRTKSKYGSRLEPFMYIDVQCYIGKSLDTVTQVETIEAFAHPISVSYDLFTAGAAMLEAADRLVGEERQPARSQFWLLVSALRALARREHHPGLILDSYLLRAFTLAGWAPALTDCAVCSEPGPHAVFSVSMGGTVCGRCRPPGARMVGTEVVELIAALAQGDWAFADRAAAHSQAQAAALIGAFTQFHLERDLRALRHVDRGASGASGVAAKTAHADVGASPPSRLTFSPQSPDTLYDRSRLGA